MGTTNATTPLDSANLAVITGTLSAPPRHRQLPSGSTVVELDVTTRGAFGTASLPVAWFDPPALAARLDGGDEIVVVGFVRRRFFRSGAVTQSRTEVVAERVVPAGRRADVRRTLQAVNAALESLIAGP